MTNKAKELLEECERYAKKNGFRLNPDAKIAKGTIRGLLQNEKKHGKRYCPCRRVTGNEEEDKKIICPCIYRKKEIQTQGHCLCQLFFK